MPVVTISDVWFFAAGSNLHARILYVECSPIGGDDFAKVAFWAQPPVFPLFILDDVIAKIIFANDFNGLDSNGTVRKSLPHTVTPVQPRSL